MENTISSINRIFECNVFDLTRQQQHVEGRIALTILLRKDFKYSLTKIAKIFGKTHATIIHYIKKHDDYMDFNREYRNKFLELQGFYKPTRWICIESEFKIRTYTK